MTAGKKIQIAMTDRGGWSPARSMKDQFETVRLECDIIECYEDVKTPGSGFAKVQKAVQDVMDKVRANTYEYPIFAIDSLTTLGDQAMRSVLHNGGKMTEYGALRVSGNSTGIEIQHWGLAMVQVENILTMLRSLPICTIVAAHEVSETVDERTIKSVSVIGAKLAPKLPAFFDEQWYANTKPGAGGTVDYVIQTKMTPSINAKSRNNLPDGTKTSIGLPAMLKLMGYEL